MFYRRLYSVTVLLIAFVLAGCTLPRKPEGGAVVNPRDARPAARPVNSAALHLSLVAEDREYLVGEPVYLTISLENRGTENERVFGRLRPADGQTHVSMSGPRKRGIFAPLATSDLDETAMVELAPGEIIGDVFPVFFGAAGWTFLQSGTYEVSASYETPNKQRQIVHVESAPISVRIKKSEDGASDHLVQEGRASLDVGKFLLWQAGDHLTEGKRRLETLIQQWPRSPLAHYARFTLAKSLSEPFSNYSTKAVRPPDCETAKRLLSETDLSVLPRNLQVQLHLARMRCEIERQDLEAARQSIERVRELIKNRVEYNRVKQRVGEYESYL